MKKKWEDLTEEDKAEIDRKWKERMEKYGKPVTKCRDCQSKMPKDKSSKWYPGHINVCPLCLSVNIAHGKRLSFQLTEKGRKAAEEIEKQEAGK